MDFKSPVGRTYIAATSSLSLYSVPIGSMSFLDFELDISKKKKAKKFHTLLATTVNWVDLRVDVDICKQLFKVLNNGSSKRYQLVSDVIYENTNDGKNRDSTRGCGSKNLICCFIQLPTM